MLKEFFSKLFGNKANYNHTNSSQSKVNKNKPDVKFHFYEYSVRGKNPKTNRLKTNLVVAKEGSSREEIAMKSGLNEPITIELSDSYFNSPPTEKQLSYTKSLGIKIPENCTSADVSCLITREVENITHDFISLGLAEYASIFNICLSACSNTLSGVLKVINGLKDLDGRECLAFWAYVCYCFTQNKKIGNINSTSNKDIYYQFADTFIKDETIMKAVKSLEFENLEYFFERKMFDRRNQAKAYLAEKTMDFLK